MSKKLWLALALGSGLACTASPARAGFSLSIFEPGFGLFLGEAPCHRPVYAPPPPVAYYPPPVWVAPSPVYYPPPAYRWGHHGHGGWRHQRDWD